MLSTYNYGEIYLIRSSMQTFQIHTDLEIAEMSHYPAVYKLACKSLGNLIDMWGHPKHLI